MTSRTFSFRYFCLALILTLTVSSNCRADETTDAVAVVENLHITLLNVMKNADKQGFQDRYDTLAPVISESFDTALIAKTVIGRHWKQLSEQQQSDFIKQFNILSISTYASRFDGFSGEIFNTLSTETTKRGRIIVKTEISSPDDEPVRLDYLMNNRGGKSFIISVIANGINDLSLKRSEYASIIKESGFDVLVSKINEKIQNMQNSSHN
jgi:phospholipid transport system substrate-binding protein